MNIHPFPTKPLPDSLVRSGFINPLAHECAKIMALGLSPISVVMHARLLQCPAMLETAFPQMPQKTRDELVRGDASLILDNYNQWSIIRPDGTGGVVVP